MGCSASKKQLDNSKLSPSVKTIEVASNEEGGKALPLQLTANEAPSERSQDAQTKEDVKKTEENTNNDKETTTNILPTQLSFVKREESDEGAEMDVSTINEIVTNSTSKNLSELTRILGSVSYDHRQLIRKKYQEKYSTDLLEEIVLDDDKDVEAGLKCLLRNHVEFLSYFMHQSIKRNDYRSLVEIVTAWPSEILSQAKEKYKEDRRVEFLEDVTNSLGEKLSEEQKSMLISLASLERSEESGELDANVLNEECGELSQGAKSIIDVFATKPYSRNQLKMIFEQFKLKYYMDIIESIEIEFQDEITEEILKTIVGIAKDTPLYFATLLNELFSKQSVNSDKLLYITIGRQSMDLQEVIKRFDEISTRSMADTITKNAANLKNPIRDLLLMVIERSKSL